MANVVKLKRGSGSDPSASDMVLGEPVLRTDTAELFFKKDDGSVAKVSGGGAPDFKYLDIRNASNNGAASYPNADFTLVKSGTTTATSPAAANTLLVSVNGVIQKPNTGTSTPSSGFALNGSTIKFGANISSAPDFIIYQESGGIGEPSDNTVTSAKIVDGSIVNADINASAAIAGTKISPDFGSQNIATTGTVGSGNITVTSTSPTINFADTNTDPDFRIQRSGTGLAIQDTTNSNATRFQINSDGHVQIPADNQKLQVGASQDLELYHDSSNSIIKNNTGGLYVDGNGVNGTYIRAKTGENSLVASPDGGVSLFFDNSKKFETTSGGVSVTGDLNIADDEFINVGTGSDFKIVHQSSDNATLLTEVGSGDLIIQGNDMILRDAGTLEKHIEMTQNGSVDIYYDGSKKFETSTNGAKIESGSANFEVYSSTDDEDAKITIIGKTASGGVGQAGRVEIVGESTNNSNGSSAMHLRTRKTNNTVTTALTINDEQKVSIGNTSPQQLLHVWPDAANTTSSYVRVTAGDRGSGTGLDLGHDSSGNCHVNAVSNAHLIFSTNSTERMRVLNGGGLTFNGDSSTDNALDDYEEGTFTPAFKATGASNNSDTTVQESRYVKIGGLVYVTMFIDMNAHGNSTGGSVNISGLPYTASGRHYPVTVGYFNNLLQNQSIFTGTVQPGTSLILLRHCTGACSATANMDYSNAIGTSTEMIVSAVYCSV